MRVQIEQWGDCLALRIPDFFAVQMTLEAGTEADLTLDGGRLVLAPIRRPGVELDALLSRITPENLHPAHESGPAVGGEAW